MVRKKVKVSQKGFKEKFLRIRTNMIKLGSAVGLAM